MSPDWDAGAFDRWLTTEPTYRSGEDDEEPDEDDDRDDNYRDADWWENQEEYERELDNRE